MSDEKDPKPMKKTSAVPLRKETVRVTLKATPEDGDAPKAPSAPKPPAPAPTIPLKTSDAGTAKPPAPAPTVQLQGGSSTTKPAAPAPTVKLNTPTATGPGTVPLAGGAAGGASSQPLPKATVQLQQTQPMGSPATPSQAATIRTADDDDAGAQEGEGAASALSVVALIAALVVLGVQLATASIWVDGDWAKLFE